MLNRAKPGMPFRWTINPYRGCEFGCKYCYARYTHEFMEMEDRDSRTRSTPNRPPRTCCARSCAASTAKMASPSAPPPTHISLPSAASDGPAPSSKSSPRERGRHIAIITKSDLVVRDIDLLREIARANVLGVNITITTLDEKLARLLEPRAPRPELRLEAVRKLSRSGHSRGRQSQPRDAADHR